MKYNLLLFNSKEIEFFFHVNIVSRVWIFFLLFVRGRWGVSVDTTYPISQCALSYSIAPSTTISLCIATLSWFAFVLHLFLLPLIPSICSHVKASQHGVMVLAHDVVLVIPIKAIAVYICYSCQWRFVTSLGDMYSCRKTLSLSMLSYKKKTPMN